MKLYLSGIISGGGTLDDEQIRANHTRFAEAADRLRARGHTVVNPVEVNGDGQPGHIRRSWSAYTRDALKAMLDCDGIVLLPGWEDSAGARLERHVADALSMVVVEYEAMTA